MPIKSRSCQVDADRLFFVDRSGNWHGCPRVSHALGKYPFISLWEVTMGVAVKKIDYPYITFEPEIAGGTPLIEGTRITVRTVAGYYQIGMSVDEIL
jgi:hypothetical protein